MPSLPLVLVGMWAAFTASRSLRQGFQARDAYLALGALILLISELPPLAAWSGHSLPNHMVSHIVIMFLAPLFVAASGRTAPLTRVGHPLLAIVLLNGVMVASHLPSTFNATMANEALRAFVVEPLFFASGLYFFAFVLNVSPAVRLVKLRWQFIAVLTTTLVMFILAMAMSIFTDHAWYSSMASMPGMAMAGDFRSQQLAAAILWICGDIWAVPVFVILVRRVISRDGSLFASLDRYASPSS